MKTLSPRPRRAAVALSLVALLGAGCSSDDDNDDDGPNLPASITAALPDLNLNTLAALVTQAGLDTTLAGAGPFTLFAPTDAAFAALDADTLMTLQTDNVALTAALSYHVLNGDVDSATASGLTSATPLAGGDVLVQIVDGELYINDAVVADADNRTQNGRIHIVDRVLLPPPANLSTGLVDRGFDNLVAAVGASSLDPNAAPLTIFAPTDAAFEQFAIDNGDPDFATFLAGAMQADIDALLSNHLVAGAGNRLDAALTAGDVASVGGPLLFFDDPAMSLPTVNAIELEGFNAPTTDGLIHTVGSVITDPGDVVQVATDAGLTTLVNNVAQAGLTGALQGAGPFTVFAPTEAAWTDMSLTALQNGMNNTELATVLQYHVISGNAIQERQLTAGAVTTLEGSDFTVSIDMNGNVTIETNPGMGDNVTANVVATNVLANNAIVHLIDTVILPPGFVLP